MISLKQKQSIKMVFVFLSVILLVFMIMVVSDYQRAMTTGKTRRTYTQIGLLQQNMEFASPVDALEDAIEENANSIATN